MQHLKHQWEKLAHHVRTAERILLISHKKPDGDTIGATTAFHQWCKKEHKNVSMFCTDRPESFFQYISNIHEYSIDEALFEQNHDLVIFLDCGDAEYAGVGHLLSKLPAGHVCVNIDHHPTNKLYGDINIVETSASSASELIYHFFDASHIRIDSDMATSLLTGLCTDTSNFSNRLTTELTLDVASELLACGARFPDILRYIWRNKTIESLQLWGKVLSRLQYNKTYDIATTWTKTEETESVEPRVLEDMRNFLGRVIKEADTTLFLREQSDGTIRGSFRGHRRDVSQLAKLLGGGGHKGAAAFSIPGRLQVKEDGRVRIV